MARALHGERAYVSAQHAPDEYDASGLDRSALTRLLWTSRTRAVGQRDPEVWESDVEGRNPPANSFQRDAVAISVPSSRKTLVSMPAVTSACGRTHAMFNLLMPAVVDGDTGEVVAEVGVRIDNGDEAKTDDQSANPPGTHIQVWLLWAYNYNEEPPLGSVTRMIWIDADGAFNGTGAYQAEWSIDPFDGTGPSRATFETAREVSTGVYGVPVRMLITQDHSLEVVLVSFWAASLNRWVVVHDWWARAPSRQTYDVTHMQAWASASSSNYVPVGATAALTLLDCAMYTTAPPPSPRRALTARGTGVASGTLGSYAHLLSIAHLIRGTVNGVDDWVITLQGAAWPRSATIHNAGATMITWRAVRGMDAAAFDTGSAYVAGSQVRYSESAFTPVGSTDVASGFVGAGATATIDLSALLPLIGTQRDGTYFRSNGSGQTLTFYATTADAVACTVYLSVSWVESE